MTDLTLLLDRRLLRAKGHALPRQRRLYELLRQAILDGRLPAGSALPASRVLAHELGLARNSVIHAYEQLGAEGYVQASRQGTVVAALPDRRAAVATGQAVSSVPTAGLAAPPPALSDRIQAFNRRRTAEQDLMPFMPGIPALDEFPLRTWRRLLNAAWRDQSPDLLSYRPAVGELELRQAIATYVRAARGVVCTLDQVIVTDGTQDSLSLCAHALADVGQRAWIEHPGYGGARVACLAAGLKVVPVPMDEQGLAPPKALWRRQPPRLIYTTPSHQYPLGSVMPLARRLALIEQAQAAGAWILEDDYDSEFRHDGPPLAAMQGLVPHAPVIYLGTFSKSMFPALRLGFMVVPASLSDRLQGALGDLVRRGLPAEQTALAAFINEGHFTKHLRKMRQLYAQRQAALREALSRHWPWPGEVLGGACGLHLVLTLPPDIPDADAAQAAMKKGLSPRPLSAYGTGGPPLNGLVIGYANLPAEQMDTRVKQLVRAISAGLAR
ncbi:PLP-dependent aminotransferase family protein [Aquabacterium sp.]|uniref:MocR-like pyridoxine biosynthesis transcription factor PdxR n=1 Tax=Aquabacterium sp. TaxID=1872578 RepID=UPI0019850C28|nr:PLP-dependent aminotransferase family protein [Aquabacterium sp.]MBC7700890.1 PLP-dependent aminotransferase family protein [Aquabacterium sp.]